MGKIGTLKASQLLSGQYYPRLSVLWSAQSRYVGVWEIRLRENGLLHDQRPGIKLAGSALISMSYQMSLHAFKHLIAFHHRNGAAGPSCILL